MVDHARWATAGQKCPWQGEHPGRLVVATVDVLRRPTGEVESGPRTPRCEIHNSPDREADVAQLCWHTMRYLTSLVLPVCFLLPACGEKAANAGSNILNSVGDATKQMASLDKLKATVGDLTKALGSITDGSTAEKAKGTLENLVGGLKGQLGDLGGLGKLTDNVVSTKDGLLKPLAEQVTKLLDNADIAKTIGPVLNQLKSLVGGA